MRDCLSQRRTRQPHTHVRIAVDPEGHVSHVTWEIDDPVTRCLETIMRRWALPPTRQPRSYEFGVHLDPRVYPY